MATCQTSTPRIQPATIYQQQVTMRARMENRYRSGSSISRRLNVWNCLVRQRDQKKRKKEKEKEKKPLAWDCKMVPAYKLSEARNAAPFTSNNICRIADEEESSTAWRSFRCWRWAGGDRRGRLAWEYSVMS
jgi:hypothetical protein